MKHTHTVILIFTIACILSACNKTEDNDVGYLTINANLDEAKTIPSSDWITGIEIVPLETADHSLIKKCDKIVLHNDKYYVLDKQQQAIFVFDKQGQFLMNTLSKKGQGPREYTYIADFYIDDETNTIELLDPPTYSIRKYDEHFNGIGEWRLDPDAIPVSKFIKLTPDIYALYDNPTERNTNIIRIYSAPDGEIIKSISLDYPLWKNPWATEQNPFYRYENQVYFTFSYANPDLYELSLDDYSASKVLEYDFGNKTFNKEVMGRINMENYFQEIDPYVMVFQKYQNSTDYYAFVATKDDRTMQFYLLKSDKATGASELIHNRFSDKLSIDRPLFIDDDHIYVLSEADALQRKVKTELLDDRSIQVLDKLTEDDNPVIIKYKLNLQLKR